MLHTHPTLIFSWPSITVLIFGMVLNVASRSRFSLRLHFKR